MSRLPLAIGLATAVVAGGAATTQAPDADFTASQARAGETAYNDSCATCHTPTLAGALDAPPLAGSDFLGMWGGRPAGDLFDYIKAAMPPAGRKPDDAVLVDIVAYILQRNGMRAGANALSAESPGVIGDGADRP